MDQQFLDLFDIAKQQGMLAEVVWSALQIMKSNPNFSEAEAMRLGCQEWDV